MMAQGQHGSAFSWSPQGIAAYVQSGGAMQLDFNRSLPVNMGARQVAPVAARQQQETVTVDPEQPEARSAKGFLVPLDERLNAKLAYDRHTRANQGAIAQYLLTQHADKREQIQKMVGIDLYA